MNLTSSCCSTPRLKVHSAWSADIAVPSASITATPFLEVKIVDTVALKRISPSLRNAAASPWINVLNPRWSTESRFSGENVLKVWLCASHQRPLCQHESEAERR